MVADRPSLRENVLHCWLDDLLYSLLKPWHVHFRGLSNWSLPVEMCSGYLVDTAVGLLEIVFLLGAQTTEETNTPSPDLSRSMFHQEPSS